MTSNTSNLIKFDESRLQGKELAIYQELLKPKGLNRFDAANHGDSCLNTTISSLRKKGAKIVDEFETVPTRWGKDVQVKRYWATTQKA